MSPAHGFEEIREQRRVGNRRILQNTQNQEDVEGDYGIAGHSVIFKLKQGVKANIKSLNAEIKL